MYRYLEIRIAEKKMAKLMYAILITKSKLVNCHHLGLEKYTRSQNAGNCVNVVIEVKENQLQNFEELSGVKLKTGKEFQGRMAID